MKTFEKVVAGVTLLIAALLLIASVFLINNSYQDYQKTKEDRYSGYSHTVE